MATISKNGYMYVNRERVIVYRNKILEGKGAVE